MVGVSEDKPVARIRSFNVGKAPRERFHREEKRKREAEGDTLTWKKGRSIL